MAPAKRPKHERDAKPQAPLARPGEEQCPKILARTPVDAQGFQDVLYCVARKHGDDERHRPAKQWAEIIPPEIF